MSNTDNEFITFSSVEHLSLYATMVLKRLTTVVQPVEECLPHLIQVIEHNLNNMEVDRKWFFATMKDHARLFAYDWRLKNMDGPDIGILTYNTLLLVVFLRLGVENLFMTRGVVIHSGMLMEELASLYYPKRPTLALKYLNQSHGLFDYLSSHSPGLEEVNIPRSDAAAFQNCMKFKNLRVLELGGRISDKMMCCSLWNVNKKSDKVLDMALKESKGLDSWMLSLPHLEVLRNNFLDPYTNSMRMSLGAAALLIQPKMKTVEAVFCWDTTIAIMYLLDMEAKNKNSSKDEHRFQLTKLVMPFRMEIDDESLERLFRACPQITDLSMLESKTFLSRLDVLVQLFPRIPLTRLVLDTANMKRLDLAALLSSSPNLTDLKLHTTPLDLAQYHNFVPDKLTFYSSPHSPMKLVIEPKKLPLCIESLTLSFTGTEMDEEVGENEKSVEEFRHIMKSFLSKFRKVNKMNLHGTSRLPASYVVFGTIEAILEELQNIKHLAIIASNNVPLENNQNEEDSDFNIPIVNHFYRPLHYSKVRFLLPCLQREATFQPLCRLESLELDALYLSPRVDRMVAALRASGVLVNIFYSNTFNQIDKMFTNYLYTKNAHES